MDCCFGGVAARRAVVFRFIGGAKVRKSFGLWVIFRPKNAAWGQKSLKIVDDVVLRVDFGAVEGYAEASEVEGEGGVAVGLDLLPAGVGVGCAVYAADDEHGACREGEVLWQCFGAVDVYEW